jgi:hypothetical protein
MEEHRCESAALPDFLYRVQYAGTRTEYDPERGLVAQNITTTCRAYELDDFKKSIHNQYDIYCRNEQPYVSLFSDLDSARNWMNKWINQRWWQPQLDWEVFTMDTSKLRDVMVFKLSYLVGELKVAIPEKPVLHIENGYLCLHTIPAIAIITVENFYGIHSGSSYAVDNDLILYAKQGYLNAYYNDLRRAIASGSNKKD